MTVEHDLIEIFTQKSAGPFLFLGSGFSRRYLNLEDWRGLLSKFCITEKPFEYYLATADGDYPHAARLISEEFNEKWWSHDDYKDSREKNKARIKDKTSALRIEISNYLSKLDQNIAKNSDYKAEVDILSTLNVDGIITTNWDPFLEQIFPDYKPYVGQEELLFSNPQGIGEIYKIHGCASKPESLILTDTDYQDFALRNPYLAAKLITLFVEHPIVFIGYSLSDENIKLMLKSIATCIGGDKIEKLRRNLIFVQRQKNDEKKSVSETYSVIDGIQIPIVLVKTDDFSEIYRAISSTKRKIPARILRYCKEQLYEIVNSAEPEKKLCVVGIDEIANKSDIEFVVGVGISSTGASSISEKGYAGIDTKELIKDILGISQGFDPKLILDQTIKTTGRATKYVPVFKYLHECGITNKDLYRESGLSLDKWAEKTHRDFRLPTYVKSFLKNHKAKNIAEILETCTPENAAIYIPFLRRDKIDLDKLRDFLEQNLDKMDYSASNYASYYRKLACLYDMYRWGW